MQYLLKQTEINILFFQIHIQCFYDPWSLFKILKRDTSQIDWTTVIK